MPIFQYSEKEILYLKKKDQKLAEAIDTIGMIKREIMPELFSGIVSCIISQQISMKAADTIWNRLVQLIKNIKPEAIHALTDEQLQKIGISMRKTRFIKRIAEAVLDGSFPISELSDKSDEEVIRILDGLPGIGVWSAEMLLIFSMNRMNILSWDDLAIRRGIMNLYHLQELSEEQFEEYRGRYSPYCSVASLYLWEISTSKLWNQ